MTFTLADGVSFEAKEVRAGQTYGYIFSGVNSVYTVGDITKNSNSTVAFGTNGYPITGLNVTGTWTLFGHNSGGYPSKIYTTRKPNHSIDNPDATINILTSSSSETFGNGRLVFGTNNSNGWDKIPESGFIWVNSLTQRAGLGVNGYSTDTGSSGVATFVLTTNIDSTTAGAIWEGNYSYDSTNKIETFSYKDAGAKIALVMRSSVKNEDNSYTYLNKTQSFTGDYLFWRGGVQMISGTLLLNYNAAMKGDETHVGHGTLAFAKAFAAEAAVLGSNSATVGGKFVFNDMTVSEDGGTIRVRMDGIADNTLLGDEISLVGKATGSGKIIIDLRDASSGVNIDDYIDFMIANNVSLKVISWSEKADDTITYTTTDGYKTYSYNSEDYYFNAVNTADGLYVSYIQVPEPATIASFFGFAALA